MGADDGGAWTTWPVLGMVMVRRVDEKSRTQLSHGQKVDEEKVSLCCAGDVTLRPDFTLL